jgi:hypothetical protein
MRMMAAVVFVFVAVGAAQAADCPANASKASYQMWAANTLRPGQTFTGKHPCGREMVCTGGQVNVKGSRVCRWK